MPTTPRCSKVSGELTVSAGTVLKANPGEIYGILATPDGTNAIVVTIYDNASAASGTVLASVRTTATESKWIPYRPVSIPASNGITYVITGTNAKVYIDYL